MASFTAGAAVGMLLAEREFSHRLGMAVDGRQSTRQPFFHALASDASTVLHTRVAARIRLRSTARHRHYCCHLAHLGYGIDYRLQCIIGH